MYLFFSPVESLWEDWGNRRRSGKQKPKQKDLWGNVCSNESAFKYLVLLLVFFQQCLNICQCLFQVMMRTPPHWAEKRCAFSSIPFPLSHIHVSVKALISLWNLLGVCVLSRWGGLNAAPGHHLLLSHWLRHHWTCNSCCCPWNISR